MHARLAAEPFGNFPSVTFRFDGAIDFATISLAGNDPQLRFVDLNDGPNFGNGRGLQYVVSSGRNRYVCQDWFALKPYTGDSLSPGTYAVIMKRGLLVAETLTGLGVGHAVIMNNGVVVGGTLGLTDFEGIKVNS